MTNPTPFLAAHGYAHAHRDPLPADASHRRYLRLTGGPTPALLMLCPPPESTEPFARIARHLVAHGLSAPRILAEDAPAGLLLLEDFGPATHATLLDAGAPAAALYDAAAETLAALHATPPPPGLPPWDAATIAAAVAATFLDWWWPAAHGTTPAPRLRAALAQAMHDTLAPFTPTRALIHRDYFPANLMPLPDRPGARRTGLLDFQDAALGHPAYDLVSLVEDARRDVPPALRRATLARYLAASPHTDRLDLLAAMAALGAARHLRVAALWVRLARRDRKPAYLRHGPRCWAMLDRSLAQPAARPLRDFLDAHLPRAMRCNPSDPAPSGHADSGEDPTPPGNDPAPSNPRPSSA